MLGSRDLVCEGAHMRIRVTDPQSRCRVFYSCSRASSARRCLAHQPLRLEASYRVLSRVMPLMADGDSPVAVPWIFLLGAKVPE